MISLIPTWVKSILATTLLIAIFYGGMRLGEFFEHKKLVKEQQAHADTTNQFKDFRERSKKLSENLSKHYQELYDDSISKANKEIEKGKLNLASANTVISRLQHTNDSLHTRLQSSSCEAAKEYAAVSGGLLGTCLERLVWYGNEANGHRINADRFERAWPENPKGIDE